MNYVRHVISRLPRVLPPERTKAGERGRILASVGGHLREWNFTNNPIIRISTVGCGCSGTYKYRGGGGAFAEDGDYFAGYHPCEKHVPGVLVLEYRTTRLQVKSTSTSKGFRKRQG